MRSSQLFGKTLRQIPSEADSISHQLLVRAGIISQEFAGVYSFLPMGHRVLRKIESVIREEMDDVGGQELLLPVLQYFELWLQSGRDAAFGESLFTLVDRKERKIALGPTHEEVVTELVSKHVQSYRDLPLLLYQIQAKFRDEPRPRGGLLRVREFLMKDLYSFDIDEVGLERSYEKMARAYERLYARFELPVLKVEADSGAIGGKDSHEFMLISDTGDDEIIYCRDCGYSANIEKARVSKNQLNSMRPLPLEEVATPGVQTIDEVANFLRILPEQTLKAVFYSADGEFVFVVIRGDMDVNETKLKNVLKCVDLHLATEEEVKGVEVVSGFASPVDMRGTKIIADDSVTLGANFIAGANKRGYHLKNVNYPRDFQANIVADIALARSGDRCPICNGELLSVRGIEVGHIFKLGTLFSTKFGASFLDCDGASKPIFMGCYGIGIGRLMAAIVECNHDDKGIIWPMSVAPYKVYLCPLYLSDHEVSSEAERIYVELQSAGIEVFFDDRDESPGIKFNDADLMGIPLRLTVSPRTLKNRTVEAKWRKEKKYQLLSVEDVVSEVHELLDEK
jgi:prolyl-tRNA synthetase